MTSTLDAFSPKDEVARILRFIQDTFSQQKKTRAVIGVSGGIDSSVSLCLVSQALGPENVTAIMMPFGDQSTDDAQAVGQMCGVPESNQKTIQIEPIVTAAANILSAHDDMVRFGNLQARSRMMILYDHAKKLEALVCGTENKSEKYLAYFTRFGDEASDIEPIQHLYKTQVRHLAKFLELPENILQKQPSAGLWSNQTDEAELGFSYHDADRVLSVLVDECGLDLDEFAKKEVAEVQPEIVQQVINRVTSQHFKHEVPYVMTELS